MSKNCENYDVKTNVYLFSEHGVHAVYAYFIYRRDVGVTAIVLLCRRKNSETINHIHY